MRFGKNFWTGCATGFFLYVNIVIFLCRRETDDTKRTCEPIIRRHLSNLKLCLLNGNGSNCFNDISAVGGEV